MCKVVIQRLISLLTWKIWEMEPIKSWTLAMDSGLAASCSTAWQMQYKVRNFSFWTTVGPPPKRLHCAIYRPQWWNLCWWSPILLYYVFSWYWDHWSHFFFYFTLKMIFENCFQSTVLQRQNVWCHFPLLGLQTFYMVIKQ